MLRDASGCRADRPGTNDRGAATNAGPEEEQRVSSMDISDIKGDRRPLPTLHTRRDATLRERSWRLCERSALAVG
jgi:hypothetical protein